MYRIVHHVFMVIVMLQRCVIALLLDTLEIIVNSRFVIQYAFMGVAYNLEIVLACLVGLE
jgi:hypothetical protein